MNFIRYIFFTSESKGGREWHVFHACALGDTLNLIIVWPPFLPSFLPFSFNHLCYFPKTKKTLGLRTAEGTPLSAATKRWRKTACCPAARMTTMRTGTARTSTGAGGEGVGAGFLEGVGVCSSFFFLQKGTVTGTAPAPYDKKSGTNSEFGPPFFFSRKIEKFGKW